MARAKDTASTIECSPCTSPALVRGADVGFEEAKKSWRKASFFHAIATAQELALRALRNALT